MILFHIKCLSEMYSKFFKRMFYRYYKSISSVLCFKYSTKCVEQIFKNMLNIMLSMLSLWK